MNWIAPLIVLAAIIAYWRSPTAAARRTLLLISALVLSGFMTWQFLPGFDHRPLNRVN